MAEIKNEIPKTALEYFKAERNKHTEPYRKFYDEVIALLDKAFHGVGSTGEKKRAKEDSDKTYLEDFKEKFPNARLSRRKLPLICMKNLYGDGAECVRDCVRCWNSPLETADE